MWKKNKLPILLLAVVAMLSVFYIHQSNRGSLDAGGRPDTEGGIEGQPQPRTVFDERRAESLNERTEEMSRIQRSMASGIEDGTMSYAQIAIYVGKMNQIRDIKVLEVAIERAIMNEFDFTDVFVQYTDNNRVDVYVHANTFNASQADSLMRFVPTLNQTRVGQVRRV